MENIEWQKAKIVLVAWIRVEPIWKIEISLPSSIEITSKFWTQEFLKIEGKMQIGLSFKIIVGLGAKDICCVTKLFEQFSLDRLLRLSPVLLIIWITLLRRRRFPWMIVVTRIVPIQLRRHIILFDNNIYDHKGWFLYILIFLEKQMIFEPVKQFFQAQMRVFSLS